MQHQPDLAADADLGSTAVRAPGAESTPEASSGRHGRSNLCSLLGQFLRHIADHRDYSPLTVRAYRRDCGRFIGFLEERGRADDPAAVTRGDVYRFVSSLDHLAPASVRRALYALSSFFRWLVAVEVLAHNPASGVEPPKRKRRLPQSPTRQQCGQILTACETPLEQAAVGLMLLGGLRRGEVLGLDVADVAADLSQLHVRGKGGRERMVPVSSRLCEMLARYLEERETDGPALIVNTAGRRMSVTSFYRLFKRVLKRAGLDGSDVSPHSLRHAFASSLVQAGVDVVTVSELLGHSNIATTSVYLHATARGKEEAVEQLNFLAPTNAEGQPLRGGRWSWSGATGATEEYPTDEQYP